MPLSFSLSNVRSSCAYSFLYIILSYQDFKIKIGNQIDIIDIRLIINKLHDIKTT